MARLDVLRTLEGGSLGFDCPGCGNMHVVRVVPDGGKPCWSFDGNYERPTFNPSVLVAWGHHTPGYGRGNGPHCQFGCDDPGEDGNSGCCGLCHSFVRDGRIAFLTDSTHALAGQTVPLTAEES